MCKYEEDELTNGGLIDASKTQGTLKEYQTVVAVGNSVRNVKVGDLVCINPERYAVKKHEAGSLKDGVITDNPVIKYNFNIMELEGVPHLLLDENDVSFIITDYEEVKEQKSDLYVPKTQIIM
jgi:co-chaperonin GroES (HSP10)